MVSQSVERVHADRLLETVIRLGRQGIGRKGIGRKGIGREAIGRPRVEERPPSLAANSIVRHRCRTI